MASQVIPYIPKTITVHMGTPQSFAEDVTVSFPDYVKNVACSEIYPTWEPAALRANILAITSFALNRVYTEFYTSQGYPFQITATTAFDQKFIKGRNIFENIGQLVDEIFNSYIRRKGFVEPLSTKFCNGTTSTCAGLSQWGSQAMAEGGATSLDILRRYYGDDIEIVANAPIQDLQFSYPGRPLRLGESGPSVLQMQVMINRIGQNYPALPRISPVDGKFGANTADAVRQFQKIFNLVPDGVVGSATWYKMVYLYVGVNQLSELQSLGQTFYRNEFAYPEPLTPEEQSEGVRVVQYMLAVIAEFYSNIPTVTVDGTFGEDTKTAVVAFQQMAGLAPDGIVGEQTWNAIYRTYVGITDTVERYASDIPAANRPTTTQYSGVSLALGAQDRKVVT